MQSSGTLQIEIKTAIILADNSFDEVMESPVFNIGSLRMDLENVRDSVVDFLVNNVDPARINTEADKQLAVQLCAQKLRKTMITLVSLDI